MAFDHHATGQHPSFRAHLRTHTVQCRKNGICIRYLIAAPSFDGLNGATDDRAAVRSNHSAD
jgi:hypothetical protein